MVKLLKDDEMTSYRDNIPQKQHMIWIKNFKMVSLSDGDEQHQP